MRQVPVTSLEEGMYCDSVYLVSKRHMGTAKTGKAFMTLTLADKTGEVTARVFNNAERYANEFAEGDFLAVQGRVQTYEGRTQIVLDKLARVAPEKVDPADFLRTGRHDPAVLLGHVRDLLATIEDEKIRELCLLAVSDETYGPAFSRAPAAQSMHHPFIGGLLEHTLSVLMHLDRVGRHYRNVNRDILLAGGLFHDIGKVRELSFETSIGYTDEGRLVSHLVIGVQILDELGARVKDFPGKRSGRSRTSFWRITARASSARPCSPRRWKRSSCTTSTTWTRRCTPISAISKKPARATNGATGISRSARICAARPTPKGRSTITCCRAKTRMRRPRRRSRKPRKPRSRRESRTNCFDRDGFSRIMSSS
ncbi:MAG: OB-fold nucleic acid binding domain-containing protein [Deltaproteobacteria bacterium]|nr:OB-fold nucleic acid binding domain-containing protein [Deltaproteobacteria bacterium]